VHAGDVMLCVCDTQNSWMT